jgi:hypothetical protein
MAASAREIIEGLREEIRRVERRVPRRSDVTPSGEPEVDALLPGGGFPRGSLCQLAGPPGSGKTALALAALARATGAEGVAAYLDARRELYPPAAAALGVDLARLLIVRPPPRAGWRQGEEVRVALWAAEALLACGAFEAVALDIPLGARCGEGRGGGARVDAMLLRVRAAAEKGGALALWLADESEARVPGALRLELSPPSAASRPRVRRALGGERSGAPAAAGAAWRGASHAA